MTSDTMERAGPAEIIDEQDPFDLDVRVLEVGGGASQLIELTDNGCGSTCSSPCATNVG